MSFFAVLKVAESPIRRIDLTPSLTDELEQRLSPPVAQMLSEDLERVAFTEGYRPDESEIATIKPFDEADSILAAIDDTVAIEPLTEGEVECVAAIVFTLRGFPDVACFQSFDKRQVISRKGIAVLLSGSTFSRLESTGLSIKESVDAVLHKAERRMEFSQLTSMRRMFDMTMYYREATRAEVEQFAASPALSVDPALLHDGADAWMRRKMTSILQAGVLDRESVSRIVEKAKEVGLSLSLCTDRDGNTQIEFPSTKKAQKDLLRFLDDDFLGSLLGSDRYVANSKRRLG